MSNPYENASAFTLFIRFTLIFLVVVSIIKLGVGMVSQGGYDPMVTEYFVDGKWKGFVKTQVVMSLIYGAFMTGYYKFFKGKKK